MNIYQNSTPEKMGQAAAKLGGDVLRTTIEQRGQANLIVATGASQFEVLKHLVQQPDIDWSKVVGFHLDEYLGLPMTHPASFRGYLKQRLVDLVPISQFHYLDGEGDAEAECDRVGKILQNHPIDVAFIGIGENAHIAFNDPPADFQTERPYLIVDLDDACRNQQLGEGWFESFADVPRQAISMSVNQILKSRTIVCSVPDQRKSWAVQQCVEGPVTPEIPASILQNHPDTHLMLDVASASRLTA